MHGICAKTNCHGIGGNALHLLPLAHPAQALSESQCEAAALQSELAAARARGAWSPGAAAFQALERKINALEAAAAATARPGGSSPIKGNAAQQTVLQALLQQQQQQYEAAMAAKSAELDAFRRQVDELLAAARKLHQQT
jgi:hypothetical protein